MMTTHQNIFGTSPLLQLPKKVMKIYHYITILCVAKLENKTYTKFAFEWCWMRQFWDVQLDCLILIRITFVVHC